MASRCLIHICFELSTLYTVLILILFILKKDFIIPLTFRSTVSKWGELQQLFKENPLVVPQNKLDILLSVWCPVAQRKLNSSQSSNLVSNPISPQCNCIREFNLTFMKNSAIFLNGSHLEGMKNLSQLGDFQARSVLNSCLMQRTTWRRDTCAHFCQIHLAVPVLVSCLCMSLFFSRMTDYHSKILSILSTWIPILLAVLVIVINFVSDALGAIPAVLTIISALFEMTFACSYMCYISYVDNTILDLRVFWSFQRFFMGSIAVWAAVTHQARDLYVVGSYATLGFFIGMLAYTEYIMRFKQGYNSRMRVVSIYVWVGICAISACLFLLVQQHWYNDSPVWSSIISVVCLFITCLQCIALIPGVCLPDTIQLMVGLFLLTVSVLTVSVDMLYISNKSE